MIEFGYEHAARTFAYQQSNNMNDALAEIETLITDFPENPFFHETKGQILYENGYVVGSIEAYSNAVKYLPDSSLLRMTYAQSLISSDDDQYLDTAIENLELALQDDPLNGFGWKQASIAYHRNDNQAMTHYSTAQYFLLSGNIRGAMINAKKAVDMLPKNTPKWVKAQDIMMTTASNMTDKQKVQREKQEQQQREQRRRERDRSN